jgi:hypothetical protein
MLLMTKTSLDTSKIKCLRIIILKTKPTIKAMMVMSRETRKNILRRRSSRCSQP